MFEQVGKRVAKRTKSDISRVFENFESGTHRLKDNKKGPNKRSHSPETRMHSGPTARGEHHLPT